jgi:hypothetical protein
MQILKRILQKLVGLDWKIVAYLGLLIYWPILLVLTFSQ